MKKLTLAALMIPALMVGNMAVADRGDYERCEGKRGEYSEHKKHRGEKMAKRIAKRLDLSEQQAESLQALFAQKRDDRQERRDQMQQMHQAVRDLDPNAADYKKQLELAKRNAADFAMARVEEKAQMRVEIAKILTDTQLAEFDQMMEKRKGRHH